MSGLLNQEQLSLESITQAFVDALSEKRDAEWRLGALLNLAMARSPDWPTALGHFATTAACSRRRVIELAEMWALFHDIKAFDRSWLWHRAVRQYAIRAGIGVKLALERALAGDWSAGDLARHGKPERVRFAGTCGECDFKVTVSCQKDGISTAFTGQILPCPVCSAVLGELRRD